MTFQGLRVKTDILKQGLEQLQGQTRQASDTLQGVVQKVSQVSETRQSVSELLQAHTDHLQVLAKDLQELWVAVPCGQRGLLVDGPVKLPAENLQVSSQYNQDHGPEKARVHASTPPAGWCPSEYHYTHYLHYYTIAPQGWSQWGRGVPPFQKTTPQLFQDFTGDDTWDPSFQNAGSAPARLSLWISEEKAFTRGIAVPLPGTVHVPLPGTVHVPLPGALLSLYQGQWCPFTRDSAVWGSILQITCYIFITQ